MAGRAKNTTDDLINQLEEARPRALPPVKAPKKLEVAPFTDIVWWKEVQRGKSRFLDVDDSRFLDFIESKGYHKIYIGKDPALVHKHNNVFEEVNPANIKDFVISYLDGLPVVLPKTEGAYTTVDLRNILLKRISHYFSEGFLFTLRTVQFIKHMDRAKVAYFYYQNGFAEITPEAIRLRPYTELDGHIWKGQIIDRYFIYQDIPSQGSLTTDFAVFMYDVAGRDEQKWYYLQSIVGYMLHSWKSEANPRAVVLMDEVISDSPEGGTGKGIFIKGLKHLKRTVVYEGKTFRFDKPFLWQRVELDTQIMAFEDVLKEFDFEKMFSVITEGINVEKKNRQEFYIPFADSPKIIITTNYALKGTGNSHDRRRIEFEFSQYYSATHTPSMKFGHMLFTEWTPEEWARFDNWMLWCVQYYLINDIPKANSVNIQRKKFINQTCDEFVEFHDTLKLNEEYRRKELHQQFKTQYPDYEKLTEKKFFSWVRAAAKLGLRFNTIEERKSDADRFMTFLNTATLPKNPPIQDTSNT